MPLQRLDSLSAISAAQWDALVPVAQPFLRHAFLSALEDTCIPGLLRTLTTQRARLTDGTVRGRGNHNLAGLCHFGKAH